MTHDTRRTTDKEGVWHMFLTGELKKSELDVTIRASILAVGVNISGLEHWRKTKFGI